MTTTTQTLRRSYSKPALLVIEIDGDALLYGASGGDGEDGGEWTARHRNRYTDPLYWDFDEDEEEE